MHSLALHLKIYISTVWGSTVYTHTHTPVEGEKNRAMIMVCVEGYLTLYFCAAVLTKMLLKSAICLSQNLSQNATTRVKANRKRVNVFCQGSNMRRKG